MRAILKEKLLEVLQAVAPLVAAVCVLQLAFIHAPVGEFLQFLAGAALAAAGMLLLFVGIDLGILPMGQYIGAELPRRGSIALIVAVGAALGFATTVAEPDVLVLAEQTDAVSGGGLSRETVIYVVALGVAAFAGLAMMRIVAGWPMRRLLAAALAVIVVMAVTGPDLFVPLAFDGGSVTTGVLSAPVMLAVAIGLSSVLAGRSALSDGFGLLGLASLGPIIAILLLGMLLS
jgi:hypothetical protein